MFYAIFDKPTLTISAAADACGMHPQTLRQYEQRGLITPHRTAGGTRMYSACDIMRLKEISALSAAGVGLEGIAQIFAIKDEMEKVQRDMQEVLEENMELRAALHRERANRRALGYIAHVIGVDHGLPPATPDDAED